METYAYDARFLCLRTSLSREQKAIAVSEQQARGKQKSRLRALMASYEHYLRKKTLTPLLHHHATNGL
jgi:hypothetical protein